MLRMRPNVCNAPTVLALPQMLPLRLARKITERKMAGLSGGKLSVKQGRETLIFGTESRDDLSAYLEVLNEDFYRNTVLGGSIGAAESYMAGHWRSDNLVALLRLMARNAHLLSGLDTGLGRFWQLFNRLLHRFRSNTQMGSRQNIYRHYDLSNEFFGLFLDETWMYSCAYFETPDMTLAQASRAKNQRLCRSLELKPSDHLLEIGTGWGGFAMHAASQFGCRVTSTTISPSQYEMAVERVHAAGLQDRVTILLEDYRELKGQYDKLVSIEMVEAVGNNFLDTFFRVASDRLRSGGRFAMQSIVIRDQQHARHIHTVDFIKRHIFPGSCLPSVTSLCTAATRAGSLRLTGLEDITPHYARTLRLWRERFLERRSEVQALGFPETFIRMWEYYLAYCEAGFTEQYIGTMQSLWFKSEVYHSSS